MAETLHLKVVTPSGCVVDKPVLSCTATSDVGELCVLPGHRLLLTSLMAGRMVVETDGADASTFAVDRGFLEAAPGHVNVITDHCLAASKIDAEQVGAEIRELESLQKEHDIDSIEGTETTRRLAWARAQLLISG